MRRSTRRTPAPLVLVAALGLAGCASDDPAEFDDGGATPTTVETAEVETTEGPTDEPTEATSDAQGQAPGIEICEPGDGRDVTMLDDVVIPEQQIPAVPGQTVEIDGETVEIPGVAAAVIPERVAESGCIVEHEAPGGCLGAVEISEARVPAYTIPERVLPEVVLPDGTVLEEVVLPAVTVEEVTVDSVRVEEVCQVSDDAEEGDIVRGVIRSGLIRSGAIQRSAIQGSEIRASVLVDRTAVPSMSVPAATAESLVVESVTIPSATLESYVLEGAEETEIAEDEEQTFYTTEGDVLFDVDEATIRPDAIPELEAVAADITERDGEYSVLVEGHTDDVRSEEYNLELSQRRADAVADWLVEQGGVDRSAITTEGHGFAYPRADNSTEEGRAQNRRVVITVSPS